MSSPPAPAPDDAETSVASPAVRQTTPLVSAPSIFTPTPSQREPSADVSSPKENLPLFLPSPSAEPEPVGHLRLKRPFKEEEDIVVEDAPGPSARPPSPEIGVVGFEEPEHRPKQRGRKKRTQPFYILVPPPPKWWKREGKRRKAQGSAKGFQDSDVEDDKKVVLNESLYRVMERPCQWKGCDVIMNSGENLLKHLILHAQDTGTKGRFFCNWKSCRRWFSSLADQRTHMETHAYYPIPCPRAGCSEAFDKPIEVMHHELTLHPRPVNPLVRALARPFAPSLAPSLEPVPPTLPAYRVEPRHIRQVSITPQRHGVIGPMVLRNIFTPVELNLRRQNAPMRLRNARQLGEGDDSRSLWARPDEYDFLASLSSASSKMPALDELDSEVTSEMAGAGLVLFGPERALDSQEDIDISHVDSSLEEPTEERREETPGTRPVTSETSATVLGREGPRDMGDPPIVDGSRGGNEPVEMMA
ncbi:hypothetical protein BV22DRAFT_1008222 [Leucogyrophana mollusca]|uniref:Uncharacterized protein n=1 Tax=Leucogyrophana mollusca TaxID=85980 RepID=A0ACB8BPG8_9AGAM|nr:hypothetical protein BV22DRAFT_1008222 [Leucogyrophana mollusca]